MHAERLKGTRALRLVPNPEQKAMSAVSDHPEREDRDTDQASGEMPAAQAITLPPAPKVPHDLMPQPTSEQLSNESAADKLRRHPEYTESSFACVSAIAIVEGYEELKRGRAHEKERDDKLDAYFADHKRGLDKLDRNLEVTNKFLREELTPRVGATEAGLDEVRRELAGMKTRLAKLEQIVNAAGTPAPTG